MGRGRWQASGAPAGPRPRRRTGAAWSCPGGLYGSLQHRALQYLRWCFSVKRILRATIQLDGERLKLSIGHFLEICALGSMANWLYLAMSSPRVYGYSTSTVAFATRAKAVTHDLSLDSLMLPASASYLAHVSSATLHQLHDQLTERLVENASGSVASRYSIPSRLD